MTRLTTLARRALLLLLSAGVLLMHTDASAVGRPSGESVAMVMAGGVSMPQFEHPALGTTDPAPQDHPNACGGGAVCRAAIAHPHRLVVPPLVAIGASEPTGTSGTASLTEAPVGRGPAPPPTCALLQVWRC